MIGRILTAAVLGVGLFTFTPQARAKEPGEITVRKQAAFRILVLIKTETKIETGKMFFPGGKINGQWIEPGWRADSPGGAVKLDPQDIDRIKMNFRTAAERANTWSKGRVRWELTVREAPNQLVTAQSIGFTPFKQTQPTGFDFAPAPEDMAQDLNEWTSPGEYDAVFVVWPWPGGGVGPQAKGLAHLPNTLKMGFATIPYYKGNLTGWKYPDAVGMVPGDIVHEWLHHLERFYGADPDLPGDMPCPYPAGPWRMPQVPNGVHAYQFDDLGYGQQGCEEFYADFLNGTIRNKRKNQPVAGGLAGHVPAFPTIREHVRAGELNLVRTGRAGQLGGDPRWTNDWDRHLTDENGKGAIGFVPVADEYGNYNGAEFLTPNAFRLGQKVTLKRNTVYVFSARSKVEGLKSATGPDAGLAFFVQGRDGSEIAQSDRLTVSVPVVHGLSVTELRNTLEGTSDWVLIRQRVMVPADGEYTVGVRGGLDARPVTGRLWFGDVALVEAPTLKQRELPKPAQKRPVIDVSREPK